MFKKRKLIERTEGVHDVEDLKRGESVGERIDSLLGLYFASEGA